MLLFVKGGHSAWKPQKVNQIPVVLTTIKGSLDQDLLWSDTIIRLHCSKMSQIEMKWERAIQGPFMVAQAAHLVLCTLKRISFSNFDLFTRSCQATKNWKLPMPILRCLSTFKAIPSYMCLHSWYGLNIPIICIVKYLICFKQFELLSKSHITLVILEAN